MEAAMTERTLLFLIATSVLAALLLAIIFYYRKRAQQTTSSSWDELLSRLNSVDRISIELIALDAIDEFGQPRKDDDARRLDGKDIWRLVGGLDGLELLEQNSVVLIDIAAYVQRWYPEALDTAAELRLNAGTIQWHVNRLRLAEESGNLEGWFANYAQNTIATYYVMTRRVLALYDSKSLPMLTDLQRAL